MTNKPSRPGGFVNVLTIIDEYSRFPFAFATPDRSSASVIYCLQSLFTLYGPPISIHSDRRAEFFSTDMTAFLSRWGVHSRAAQPPIVPAGNGQTENYDATIWKTVLCILTDQPLPDSAWPSVLGKALHCIRSLINTTTGDTPHDRFCTFTRRHCPAPNSTIASGNYAWLRRHIHHKSDPSGDLVKTVAAYPGYAVISRDGQSMDTVNWRHLAPHPDQHRQLTIPILL